MTSTTRTTSSYFLRVALTRDPRSLLASLTTAVMHDRPVIDQHTRTADPVQPYVSVGYRATSDEDATELAQHVVTAAAPGTDWVLITGYGIHRRTVTDPALETV